MLNRRSFIHQLTGGAAALAGSSMLPPARVLGANDRVRFASLAPAAGERLSSKPLCKRPIPSPSQSPTFIHAPWTL